VRAQASRRRYRLLFGSALGLYLLGALLYVSGWLIAAAVFALVFVAWAARAPRGASIALAVWVTPAMVANFISGDVRLTVIAVVDLTVFVLALGSLPSARLVVAENARRRNAAL
jgi:hypothetical protein